MAAVAEVEKIEGVLPEITVTRSIDLDLKQYANPSKRVGRVGRDRGCHCDACNRLRARRDAILAARNQLANIIASAKADATPVAMSIEVTTPGFYLLPNLKRKSEGRFTHIYFSETGVFSLVSLYKHMRENGDNFPDGPLTKSILKKIDGKVEQFKNNFSSILPYPITNLDDLNKDKVWKKISKTIVAGILNDGEVIEEEESNEVSFEGIFLLYDRYIPFFVTAADGIYIVGEDGTPKLTTGIPGLPTENKNSAHALVAAKLKTLLHSHNAGYDYDNTLSLQGWSYGTFAYDTREHKLIWSPEIDDAICQQVKKNIDTYNKDIKGFKAIRKLVENLPSAGAVVNATNRCLRDNGYPSFSVEFVAPVDFQQFYAYYDWEKRREKSVQDNILSFYACINYKDKPFIGPNGRHGGHVVILPNEDMSKVRMVQSAWCQRVSSWSKNVEGKIDQRNNIWELGDWLGGPFAEKVGLILEEAPLVFFGNKARDKKQDVLAKMQERLANANKKKRY